MPCLKKRLYLNRHLKRIHSQGTSGQETGVKLVQVVSPAVETERNESDHELSSDDDIARYDPGNLIREVSDSVDEDGSESEITDKQTEVSGKVLRRTKLPQRTTLIKVEPFENVFHRFRSIPPGKKGVMK